MSEHILASNFFSTYYSELLIKARQVKNYPLLEYLVEHRDRFCAITDRQSQKFQELELYLSNCNLLLSHKKLSDQDCYQPKELADNSTSNQLKDLIRRQIHLMDLHYDPPEEEESSQEIDSQFQDLGHQIPPIITISPPKPPPIERKFTVNWDTIDSTCLRMLDRLPGTTTIADLRQVILFFHYSQGMKIDFYYLWENQEPQVYWKFGHDNRERSRITLNDLVSPGQDQVTLITDTREEIVMVYLEYNGKQVWELIKDTTTLGEIRQKFKSESIKLFWGATEILDTQDSLTLKELLPADSEKICNFYFRPIDPTIHPDDQIPENRLVLDGTGVNPVAQDSQVSTPSYTDYDRAVKILQTPITDENQFDLIEEACKIENLDQAQLETLFLHLIQQGFLAERVEKQLNDPINPFYYNQVLPFFHRVIDCGLVNVLTRFSIIPDWMVEKIMVNVDSNLNYFIQSWYGITSREFIYVDIFENWIKQERLDLVRNYLQKVKIPQVIIDNDSTDFFRHRLLQIAIDTEDVEIQDAMVKQKIITKKQLAQHLLDNEKWSDLRELLDNTI